MLITIQLLLRLNVCNDLAEAMKGKKLQGRPLELCTTGLDLCSDFCSGAETMQLFHFQYLRGTFMHSWLMLDILQRLRFFDRFWFP